MSKKFKSQASSARAASALTGGFGFGSSFQTATSSLSYVTELPDLSRISEPNVVVAFKNLGKKDSTTKAKALEELQEYCSTEPEQAILHAWADIYPRTSIDNSRRVRQLAHTLQGSLTVSAGKRIAPLLSKVIGSWLAGTFDSDKSVARSAQDALERSFSTQEKRNSLWSVYKDALLEYVEDAVTVQTAATLSDERTTSNDDSQAKYVRVAGTGLNMLAHLLKSGTNHDSISTLLRGKKLWEFAYHPDPYMRRSICELVQMASERNSVQLDWTTISTSFLSKGLHSNQAGSSRQYTSALLVLTQQRPQLWTSDFIGKTAASKRLVQFLKQGSQSGPEDVWSNITALIRLIPEQVWLGDNQYESAVAMAEALRTGVTQPTERINAAAAWATYVQTCLWMAEKIELSRTEFINQQLVPIVNQYVTRRGEQQWNITIRVVQICKGILTGILKQGLMDDFEATWTNLVSSTIDLMKLSQPESSKEFNSSQDAVVEQTKRLFNVKSDLQKSQEIAQVDAFLEESDMKILDAAIQLLRVRNGKPYGAAGSVEIIVNQSSFDKSNATVRKFLQDDLPSMINSPSSEMLASVALMCGQTSVIDSLLAQRSNSTDKAASSVLTRMKPEDLSQGALDRLSTLNLENLSDADIMSSVMQNSTLLNLHLAYCKQIQQATSLNAPVDLQNAALSFIETQLRSSTPTKILTSDENRSSLLSNLLVLADAGNDRSERANTIVTALNSKTNSSSGSVSIIQQQLNGDGIPLSIFTLVDLANSFAQADGADLNAIMPLNRAWEKALLPHTSASRPCSLSLTSPLQGAIYIVDSAAKQPPDSVARDQDGFSLAFRLVLFVTKILTSELADKFQTQHLQAVYLSYPMALQLVSEKLSVESANEIWLQSSPEVLQEAADVLSDGNRLIQSWLKSDNFVERWLNRLHTLDESNSIAYTTSSAWTNITSQFIDQQGPTRILQEYDTDLKIIHKSPHTLRSAALLAVLREYLSSTSYGQRVLNELVVDATELKGNNIKSLILLNIIGQADTEVFESIPNRRIVFMFESLIRQLDDRTVAGKQSEAMKLLTAVVPQVKELYGEYWEQTLNKIVKLWTEDIDIPTMNSSVRLYVRLKSLLKAEDTSEDLRDAWNTTKSSLDAGLIDCLRSLGQPKLDMDQPRIITAELVRRQLRDIELKSDVDVIELLSSPMEAVQNAAFEILHHTIPQQQEQLSVQLVLEKQVPHLPDGLVSHLTKEQNDTRTYMLAWSLTFVHFSKASYKLQEAYTSDIKASGHIDGLLDYICDVLRIASGRPVDASKFDIANFNLDEAESAEKEMQWLAIHNYYNALLCVPSLAKEWFISQKNRVKSPLESWTQKHISPTIIAASLSTVTNWATTQSQDDDDKPLTIKSSPRGSELTAAIAVDPESPPISLAITLPGSYPLESPVVTSRTRVGVSEKNWQSWLRTIQIIVFSTGSIIEGLIAFRRNVYGALKGQSECAICYSIIGTDMQTPNKKCGTCKNNFHGTCLFRWFKSSNSSSCPLCRNNFNYA